MGTMQFDVLTLTTDPNEVDPIVKPKRSYAIKETYTDVAFFSWGSSYVGNRHTLKWNAMSATQYDAIQALIDADVAVTWTLNSTLGESYTVQLLEIRGEYIHSFGTTFFGGTAYRKNCELDLIILEEI
jgi:hypothetical protein